MPRAYKNTYDKSTYKYYTLAVSGQFKVADLRKEYAKMRKEAERRLTALSKSKNETARALYRQYGDIATSRKPRNKIAYAKSIIAMEHFLSLRTSKVTEIYRVRRQILDTLHEHGYDFITENNLKKFGDFMDYMFENKKARAAASSQVMEFLEQRAEKKGISANKEAMKKEFEEWLKKKEKKG